MDSSHGKQSATNNIAKRTPSATSPGVGASDSPALAQTEGQRSQPRKMGIGLKLGLLLSIFAVMASGLTGYYTFSKSRSMLISSAESELLTSTQVLGRRFGILLNEIANNVRLLANMPSVQGVFAPPKPDSKYWRPHEHLADVFSSMLRLHPEYFQIRLIGAADHGRELVRVDRDENRLSRVMGEQLQEKAQYPYVYQTLRLQPGQIYLSHIEINHELGAHQGLNKPTLQMATPVAAATGEVVGLIVVNIDLDGLFKLLQEDLPHNIQLYLTNQDGDFLIHPDHSQEFGFDRGRRVLIQDSFPATRDIFDGKSKSLVLNVSAPRPLPRAGSSTAVPPNELAAAFTKLPLGALAPDRFVVLGLAMPLQTVFAGTHRLGLNIIHIILAFSLLAVLVAMITSRAVSRPLNMMVSAVKRFSDEHVMGELPIQKNDEIGLLARTFADMQNMLRSHLDDLHQTEVHLHHLAQHDTLTNLPNRLLLFDRMRHAIAKAHRTDKQVALIFIDLDRFKDINDSLGHAVGDEVIKSVAQQISQMLRVEDTVARLGGDEFIVVLEAVDHPQQVASIAQKLLLQLQQPFRLHGRDLYLSASMGISLYPQDGNDAETLLRNADAAMYRAKDEGRNMFHFYTEDMTTRALARVHLESEMRQALEYGGFIPYYQPQIDLKTGKLIGVEALVRWRHADGNLLMPGHFITLAEETGLIEPIGEQVLEQSCRQMKEWYDAGLNPGRVAVNLSGKQLRKRDLLPLVLFTLEQTGCSPEWLELEVTESFFLERPEEAISILEDLRSTGIELAIDDFGTGYSSLSYLKHLPISKLKIDRSFISNIPQDADDKAITRAIIAMAKSLDMRVIAEGVETEQQRNFLIAEGCDEAQGFYYSKAVPPEEIVRMLLGKASA